MNEKPLKRAIRLLFPSNSINFKRIIRVVTSRAAYKIKKQINDHILPRIPRINWLAQGRLNPGNLLKLIKNFILSNCKTLRHNLLRPDSWQILHANIPWAFGKDKLFKIRAILSQHQWDIVGIQESHQGASSSYFRHHSTLNNVTTPGQGGVVTICNRRLHVLNENSSTADATISTCQQFNSILIYVNIYLSARLTLSEKKDRLHLLLQETHYEAIKYEDPIILFGGDFNMKDEEVQSALKGSRSLKTLLNLKERNDYSRPEEFKGEFTRKGISKGKVSFSKIDYIFSNVEVHVNSFYQPLLSDHLIFTLTIPIQKSKERITRIFRRQKIIEDLKTISSLSLDTQLDYLRVFKSLYSREMKISLFQKTIDNLDLKFATPKGVSEWLSSFQLFASHLTDLRFSSFQKTAFDFIRKISKYDQFQRRDGSIVSVIYESDPIANNSLITDPILVNRSVIQHLKTHDEKLQENLCKLNFLKLPNLPPLSEDKLKCVLDMLSQHKALACFPLPDEHLKTFLQKGHSIISLNRIWDPAFLSKYPEIFDCRLIPLNKVHPKIPRVDQIRPIVVTNPLYKLLESRFLKPLQDFFLKIQEFGLSQYGFLPYMTTQIPINNLLCRITEGRIRNKTRMYRKVTNQNFQNEEFVLYIDFESAYNSVNLQLLFHQLLKLKIPNLSHEDMTFLFSLISRLYIHLGDASFHPHFGVPQGGITSPILFDYAMYFMIQETIEAIDLKIVNSSIIVSSKKKKVFPSYKFQHRDIFIWADDLAIRFSAAYGAESKALLKCILEYLISQGTK